ncbi:MAG: ferrochelatase, partial [Candidatus Binatia bacterium]
KELRARLHREGIEAETYVGMRCWRPTIDEAIDRLLADGVGRVVGLPLYPQFSLTSTGSALTYFAERLAARELSHLETITIRQWYDDPGYVEALAETIRTESALFPDPDPANVHLLYSAHSIPIRYVERGDPYAEQTRRTVELVNRSLGNRSRSTLAFQSKVGWQKWLEPSTAEVIADLGRSRTRQVLAIPVSFVSDHIETLYEMDMLFRDMATAAGIPHFRRAPALNCSPRFIGALAGLVRRGIAELDENASRSAGAASRRA